MCKACSTHGWNDKYTVLVGKLMMRKKLGRHRCGCSRVIFMFMCKKYGVPYGLNCV
jgi:hypothetical protein